MEKRLADILKLVIEDVVQTGEPVGSQNLVLKYGLDMSSATIRNWFAELEKGGWIEQPHTSSGRMPTEKGYRLYVDELMAPKPLPKKIQDSLRKAVQTIGDRHQKIKLLAKGTANLVGNAVVVGLNEADTFYTGLSQLFSQPEFKDWNNTVSLTQVLDGLDEMMNAIRRKQFPEPTALIGKECPFGSVCGVLLLTLRDDSLIGILGPMRQDYQKAMAALNSIKEIL